MLTMETFGYFPNFKYNVNFVIFTSNTFHLNLHHATLLKSADYWNRPQVPERIYESLGPKMKFLVMLRDPVDRIHSDYNFNVSSTINKTFVEDRCL